MLLAPLGFVVEKRSGLPAAELMVRDTGQVDFRISASLLRREVKVQINLPRFWP